VTFAAGRYCVGAVFLIYILDSFSKPTFGGTFGHNFSDDFTTERWSKVKMFYQYVGQNVSRVFDFLLPTSPTLVLESGLEIKF
jgi:hypothetical protein